MMRRRSLFGAIGVFLTILAISLPLFIAASVPQLPTTSIEKIRPTQPTAHGLETIRNSRNGSHSLILGRITNPATSSQSSLQGIVTNFAENQPGNWGIYIYNLDTGTEAEYNADEQFNVASLYKLQVLYAAYAEERAGNLSLDEELPEGWTVASALNDMITISDQGATFALLRRIGTDTVNATMANLGLDNSYITDWGYSTARETGALLTMMATGEAVDATASEAMLALLFDQKINDRLPAYLPEGIVAHKTGELEGIRNDAGIIYGPNSTYVMVVISQEVPDNDAASAAIADLSATIYGYLN